MSRRYQDLVDVRLGDPDEHRVRLEPGWRRGAQVDPDGVPEDVPTAFLWQGRVHVVRGVLAQWTQRVPWWRRQGEGAPGGPSAEVLEQQVWRVEASAGRTLGRGVYDLVQDEQWRLERVSD
ncbi:MAG TPA: DUF6504 family protein, partial [Ornithinimicrobium sp.]|nr:DUF6504 family protein [Ornithinimicrobium sp.]